MIDPVIFSVELFGINLTLRWYGVIVMIGVIVGSLIVERELKRRGENGDRIWDALIWEGGLHIFGGFLFGAAALVYYLRQNKLDPWLFLDAAGPAALVGQGIGRLANFINQELYGPPTTLPWGIPIAAEHRLPQYQDVGVFPVESTRFHPTFAYEMLWNFASAGLLLWLSRRYKDDIKPGTIFAGWLTLAGIGRVIIEFFRPDQPKIPSLGISYSSIFAALMALAGIILLLARYRAIHLNFAEGWEEQYKRSTPQSVSVDQPSGAITTTGENGEVDVEGEEEEDLLEEQEPRPQKTLTPEEEAEAAQVRMEKLIGRRTIGRNESTPPAKKSP